MKHSKLQAALTAVWLHYGTSVTAKNLASPPSAYPACAFRTSKQQAEARRAWTHLQKVLETTK